MCFTKNNRGFLISKKKTKDETKAGAPSKYDPKFCKMLIQHMGKGHSFESFGAVIDVHRDTLYEWAKAKHENGELKYPEFSDAKKKALDKNLLFMETLGLEGMWCTTEREGNRTYTKALNTGVFCFFMKNVHRWKDKPEDEENAEKTLSIKMNYAKSK